jgi:hypothetical protein
VTDTPTPAPVAETIVPSAGNLDEVIAEAAAPWPTSSSTGGLVDRYGRSFDPNLHLTNKKGKPAITPSGRLITLKGKAPAGGKVKIPGLAGPSPTLVLEPEPATAEPKPAPVPDPEVGAAINAEVLVDLWHVAAALIFGPKAAAFKVDELTEVKEDKRLFETGKRWLIGSGRTKPAGAGLVHGIAGVRYFLRAASTPEGRQHLADLIADLKSGFKRPNSEEAPK